MADLTVAKGDFGFYLNFTVQNSDGTAFNLTGYVVTINVWQDVPRPAALFTGNCPHVVAASGTCRYLVVTGDFPTKGAYRLELELTQAGVNISTRPYDLNVTESI